MERIGRIRRAHGAGTLFAVSHQRRRCFQMFSKLVDVQGDWSRRHWMMCVHMHVLAERLAWGVTFCGESSGHKKRQPQAAKSSQMEVTR